MSHPHPHPDPAAAAALSDASRFAGALRTAEALRGLVEALDAFLDDDLPMATWYARKAEVLDRLEKVAPCTFRRGAWLLSWGGEHLSRARLGSGPFFDLGEAPGP